MEIKNKDTECIILNKKLMERFEIPNFGVEIPCLKKIENVLISENRIDEKTRFLIDSINNVNTSIKSINFEGYVNTADLSLYPVISEGLNQFLLTEEEEKGLSLEELKLKSKSKSKVNKDEEKINLIEKVKVGEVNISVDECKDLYK